MLQLCLKINELPVARKHPKDRQSTQEPPALPGHSSNKLRAQKKQSIHCQFRTTFVTTMDYTNAGEIASLNDFYVLHQSATLSVLCRLACQLQLWAKRKVANHNQPTESQTFSSLAASQDKKREVKASHGLNLAAHAQGHPVLSLWGKELSDLSKDPLRCWPMKALRIVDPKKAWGPLAAELAFTGNPFQIDFHFFTVH